MLALPAQASFAAALIAAALAAGSEPEELTGVIIDGGQCIKQEDVHLES